MSVFFSTEHSHQPSISGIFAPISQTGKVRLSEEQVTKFQSSGAGIYLGSVWPRCLSLSHPSVSSLTWSHCRKRKLGLLRPLRHLFCTGQFKCLALPVFHNLPWISFPVPLLEIALTK